MQAVQSTTPPIDPRRVEAACNVLTFEQRSTFELAYYDNQPLEKIADREGFKLQSIKNRMYRARQRARRHGHQLPTLRKPSVRAGFISLSSIEGL